MHLERAFRPSAARPGADTPGQHLTHNTLSATAGVSREGGGLFTTVPVTLDDTVIADNSPDQCFGC
jgi:hypothetical protein